MSKRFFSIASQLGMKPVQFQKVQTTRFSSYLLAIKPVLADWYTIVEFYKDDKNSTNRQKNLIQFFVTQEFMSKIKLDFITAACKELIEGLDFFEQRKDEIHRMHDKMTELLTLSLIKHPQCDSVETIDDEGNVERKPARCWILM